MTGSSGDGPSRREGDVEANRDGAEPGQAADQDVGRPAAVAPAVEPADADSASGHAEPASATGAAEERGAAPTAVAESVERRRVLEPEPESGSTSEPESVSEPESEPEARPVGGATAVEPEP